MSPINMLTGLSGGEIGAYFCDFESCPNSSQRTAIGHDPRASMAMWHGEGGRRSQQRGMEREWGDRQEGEGAAVTGNGEGEGSNDKRERGSGNAAWRVVVAMQRRDGGVIQTHPVAFEARMGFNRFWSKGGGRLAERREDIQ